MQLFLAFTIVLACAVCTQAFQTALPASKGVHARVTAAARCSKPNSTLPQTVLYGKRPIEEELAKINRNPEDAASDKAADDSKKEKKEKVKLEAEETIFEGGPDVSETFVPALSIITVLGIIPFAASLARQAWVRYTITSRRIRVVSGINGKDETELVYPDIKRMVFVYRWFGRCGDVVMELRDGSKMELRSLPDFAKNYNYILGRTSAACQEASNKIKPKEQA